MKIGKHDITLKNIHAYLQGNLRYLAEQYGPEFIRMEPHVREQVMFRMDISKPECISNKQCTDCGCDVPELMYADKQCGGECYPEMMNKEEWEDFKKALRIHTIENNIEKISYPFDWRLIKSMMTLQDELKEKEYLIKPLNTDKIKDETFDAGDIPVGQSIIHVFTLYNPNDVSLFVKNVATTCGCTTADSINNKIIESNKSLDVTVKVNTENKREGVTYFNTEVLLSNDTITKLTIKANIIKQN